MDLSVAICTYNGAGRLPDVLDRLVAQRGTDGLTWEVLVIDNNSDDATREVVRRYANTWPATSRLRYRFEGRQGKAFALEQAMREAAGPWVALLDDDNWPDPDWVAEAHRFAASHPRAGAFGGQIHGRFDTDLPASFGLVQGLFAIKEQEEVRCYNGGGTLEFGAPGAGLVVRRQAWLDAVPDDGLRRKGPTGDARGAVAEDFEMQWHLHEAGWEIWHNPAMHMEHHIPQERLEPAYLHGFFRAIARSRHPLRMLQRPRWQRLPATLAHLVVDAKRLAQLTWTYRRHLRRDPFVQGRLQMLLWMIAHPFQRAAQQARDTLSGLVPASEVAASRTVEASSEA